jgi:hypothetical protein
MPVQGYFKKHPISFSYWIGEQDLQVQPETGIWHDAFPIHPDPNSIQSPVTYGDYFKAVQVFLEQDDGICLQHAIDRLFENAPTLRDIDRIAIHLIKHGEFYHPGRIDICLNGVVLSFLVNVALSKSGMVTAENEFELLNRLKQTGCGLFLPEVIDLKKNRLASGLDVWIFSAQWLDGFHEWHISRNPDDGNQGIVVWNATNENQWLSRNQTDLLYRKIAEILTCFYQPDTGDQIFPWHHAAGDFIIRIKEDRVDVRLVTIRQYGSMLDLEIDRPEDVFLSVMLFLCNLSIRTRLDRVDGTGDYIWADSAGVRATVAGFMDGLMKKEPFRNFSKSPAACFLDYAHTMTHDDVHQLCTAVVNAYNPKAPEMAIIHDGLPAHSESLYQVLLDL